MEALFSSSDGGTPLRERVLEVIRDASQIARSRRVDIHLMTFSFTDRAIAEMLADIAASRPDLTIRLIADWSQGAEGSGRQVRALAALGLPNLLVRYKNDQPYVWDADTGRMSWSYRTSRGLLHHKTLAVFVDGAPQTLVCGSFNWTEKAARSYENLLVLTNSEASAVNLMTDVEREFEAMWADGRATLSPSEAQAQHAAILAEYHRHPHRLPTEIACLSGGLNVLPPSMQLPGGPASTGAALIAFSARSPHHGASEAGYSAANRDRRFELEKPSGKTKQVPLTLTNLALDTIARAGPDDRLLVAMYGLSTRVPEYGALLDAARRGVRLRILLDGQVGRSVLVQLATTAHRAGLPIRLRAGTRTMHQKYLVHPETDTVLTGTANFSTDAARRHTEHRIVWRNYPTLAAAFAADFDAIWGRLPSPFGRAGTAQSGSLRPLTPGSGQA